VQYHYVACTCGCPQSNALTHSPTIATHTGFEGKPNGPIMHDLLGCCRELLAVTVSDTVPTEAELKAMCTSVHHAMASALADLDTSSCSVPPAEVGGSEEAEERNEEHMDLGEEDDSAAGDGGATLRLVAKLAKRNARSLSKSHSLASLRSTLDWYATIAFPHCVQPNSDMASD
jgi:hypothetical protein